MHLVEGGSFPQDYQLDKKLAESNEREAWVATNERTGERAVIKFFKTSVDEGNWGLLAERINALKGLVHENIVTVSLTGTEQGMGYLVEAHVPNAAPLDPDTDDAWSLLQQVISALEYTHALGIAHGYLHTGNILVDSENKVAVTGFGLPSGSARSRTFMSPQVKAGEAPAAADDIYSLGCLIYRQLTGCDWQSEEQSADRPVPARLKPLLDRMLSHSPFERSIDLTEIRRQLADHFNAGTNNIQSVHFSRVQQEAAPPLLENGQTGARQQKSLPVGLVAAGAAVLLVVTMGIFYLLPGEPSVNGIRTAGETPTRTASGPAADNRTPAAANESEPGKIITPFEAARLEFVKQEGERLAREILKLQLSLEDRGVHIWGASAFSEIADELQQAEETFGNADYPSALSQYENVLNSLTSLDADVPEILAASIQEGDEALAAGTAETALKAFTIALAIEKDPQVADKLTRAENLDEVLSLVRRGQMLEREGGLDEALAAFSEARALDALWQPAQAGVNRMTAAITQRKFRAAMSDAFSAMTAKDYDLARRLFADALQILPDSAEPADGLLQVEQAERNDAINRHRTAAEGHVATNEWLLAIDEYEAALAVSNSLSFAQEGLAYARGRLTLNEKLQKILKDPTLLQEDDELELAALALREAARIENPSDELKRYIDTVARLVSTARMEVPVRINSDGKTVVTVRRHAVLGTLTNETVYLIPGRYTITGERSGYRDVREDLVIVAGRPVPDVTIASTERVR
jgi:hypothetical protein